ncbi:hypothetical protein F5Y10DRAFT_261984 [Nemania abortiva]|nr:hypothetical protein F5Y10DRAFT_261984 [Nemania abortiva]
MAAIFDLSTYQCTYLPNPLWRVTHSQSQSKQDPVTGDLVASDSDRKISDKSSLKQAVEEHFNWGSRRPSCFLSVFKNKEHARRWAKRRERTIGVVYIHEIDTNRLPLGTYIFDAASLVTSLGIVHPYSDDELIFLHRIPSESLRKAEALAYAARSFNPDCHYVSELHGWYNSDEECEERNRSDDIIRMIEGEW